MASVRREPSLSIDTSWLLAARTVSFVVSLALPLFLVRHLDQVQFGLYKQAFLFVNSAVAIVPLGFGMSALYFLPRDPGNRGQTVLNILMFNSLVGGLVCFALILRSVWYLSGRLALRLEQPARGIAQNQCVHFDPAQIA